MAKFGLIGKRIDYSFSKSYFTKKFEREAMAHSYQNYDIDSIDQLPKIINSITNLKGLNVTIPFKETIIPFLDELDGTSKNIGAVNTIKILDNGKIIGYNTDYYGFKKSIAPLLKSNHKKALILGTGGASKAIAYGLKQLEIPYAYVSRTPLDIARFTYDTLTKDIISNHQIVINCTPLGTFPKVDDSPKIPYSAISKSHILFDLIYNPAETRFLTLGKQKGAVICNGLNMLELQAEKAWEIWNGT